MIRAPRSHNLIEIAPRTYSNGHLLFRPSLRPSPQPSWDVLLANRPVGQPVAFIRFNSIWNEYALLTRSGFVFAHDCLADISQLLATLNAQRPTLAGQTAYPQAQGLI